MNWQILNIKRRKTLLIIIINIIIINLFCLFDFFLVMSQVQGDKVWKDRPGAEDPVNIRLQRERPHVSYGVGAQESDDVGVPAGRCPGNVFICVPVSFFFFFSFCPIGLLPADTLCINKRTHSLFLQLFLRRSRRLCSGCNQWLFFIIIIY